MIAKGVGGGAGARGRNLTEGCSKSEGGWRLDQGEIPAFSNNPFITLQLSPGARTNKDNLTFAENRPILYLLTKRE